MAWFSDVPQVDESNSALMGTMEDPFIYDQCDIMDFLNEASFAEQEKIFQTCSSPSPTGNDNNSSNLIQRSISTNNLCASTVTDSSPSNPERPTKQRKTNNQKKPKNNRVSSSPIILTFGNPTMSEMNPQEVMLGRVNTEDDAGSEVMNSLGTFANNLQEAARSPRTPKRSGGRSRPASQTYDHIIAERKRREQLSQRFVALSRLVPGLKKMDKSSVLGETIKYLNQLQDRVKALEEQSTKQRMESYVLVKRSQPLDEDERSSDETVSCNDQELNVPEIEVKLCDKHVLLRVHCEKNKRVLINLLTEIENLNLSVTSTSFVPFGCFSIDITITAEMPAEFNLTMKELVKALQSALGRPAEEN